VGKFSIDIKIPIHVELTPIDEAIFGK